MNEEIFIEINFSRVIWLVSKKLDSNSMPVLFQSLCLFSNI